MAKMVETSEQQHDGIITYSYGNDIQYSSLRELSKNVCDSILLSSEQSAISLLSIRVDGTKLSEKSNSDLYYNCFSILKKMVVKVRNERREKVQRRLDEELDNE